jgi:hypothetical protein
MLQFIQIRDFLPLLDIDEVDDLLLTVRVNRDSDLICQEQKDFEFISKAL